MFSSKRIPWEAVWLSIKKLNPIEQFRNPVVLLVYLSAVSSTILTLLQLPENIYLESLLTICLWGTVLFSNFAEALAERRGKAQADTLRKARTSTIARVVKDSGKIIEVPSIHLKPGDLVLVKAGEIIPGDGEVVEGIASVDESAITGESAPVIRESGGDRSAVTGGTRVVSDSIKIRISTRAGDSFLDRMISLIEGAKRQRTPNEVALSILLFSMTMVFLVAVISLEGLAYYSGSHSQPSLVNNASRILFLINLFVCVIPTTISGLLSAIGISGINQLVRHNVLAMSGRAVEVAGDVDVLLLDKTGTITLGNRMATRFIPAPHITPEELADAAQLASLADETPEGRSIVILAKEKFQFRSRNISELKATFIPFSANTRMSGVDLIQENGSLLSIRKGAADAVEEYLRLKSATLEADVKRLVSEVAMQGSTPLVVTQDTKVLGVIELKDVVKGGIKERFAEFRKMGIRTIMITGDNPLTAAAIAAEAGVDDFIAEATPEAKLLRIRSEQKEGHLVAMIGDGTNDAPALAQADVGIAMNSGTQAAREAGNMVDLDSNPTKLLEVVAIGKRILMTRGALTTFSVSNDIAKYFAIIPALFGGLYADASGVGPLSLFNIMALRSSESAILSASLFNAFIILALIPIALKGVDYQPLPASKLIRKNFLIFGVGGIIAPFIGIKLIDLLIVALGLVS